MEKRPIGYIPGKGNPLDKKPPKNAKYDKIGPTVKTGYTVKDINTMSDKLVAKRKNELFKRIKTSTLAKLLKQDNNQESIYNLKDSEEQKSSQLQDKDNQIKDNESIYSMQSNFSIQSIQSEASKYSIVTCATEQIGITSQTVFILLDLREPEEYEEYHIKESINFASHMITRDKLLPELYRCKNQPDKMIIIYHFDERQGIPVAQQFVQKGFDNVYLISGGIEQFMKDFPEWIEGKKIPVVDKSKLESVGKKQLIKRSNHKESPKKSDIRFEQDNFGDVNAKQLMQNQQCKPNNQNEEQLSQNMQQLNLNSKSHQKK